VTGRGSGAVGVFTTDRALVVRSWDAWVADATGVAEGDATGRALAELYPELEARGLLPRLQRVVESGVVELLAPAFHEYLIPCPPRAPSAHFARMQQLVTIAPLRAGGDVAGLAVTIEDVTTRRERERDLALQLQSADDAVRLSAARALAAAEGGPPAPLAGALGDRSWRVRRVAAEGLARGRDDSTLDALLAAVRDRHRDPAVLNAALAALIQAEQDVVPPLVGLLGAPDADVRTYAALALGLLEDRRAVPALVRALGDADANVRYHAIEALGRVRSREAALPVAAVAATRDFSVAFAALDTLALIGEPSVAPRVVPLLEDDLLQTAAAEALGRLGGEDAVAPLAALLERGPVPAASAAAALAALSDRLDDAAAGGVASGVADLARALATPAAARNLIDALPEASKTDRRGVVVVLGWLNGGDVDRALADALAHADVRGAAADALARRGASAVQPLLAALAHDDAEVRKAAAATLGRIGAPAALPALVALLGDVAEVAVVAAGALGAAGDRRALEPLLAQLDHPQAAARQAAVAALNSIGHPELPGRLRELLRHPSPRVRESAARTAGYSGDAGCVEPLLALCRDADDSVARAAVEQLPHFDDPRALAAVVQALDAGSSDVRAAAARALARVTAGDALPRLLDACRDADPWVRYYAARSAGHHGRPEATTALVHLAALDSVPPVRIAAVEALATIRTADGLAALLPLVDDPEPAVAEQALLALGQSSDPGALPALLAALRSDDRGRRLAALDALAHRAGAGVGDAGVADAVAPLARDAADPEEGARALDVLAAAAGDADAVAALIEVAAAPRRTAAVVDALARLGERQLSSVGRGLSHPDVAVRCAVVEALGRMRQPAASALLAEALHDAEESVRVAAEHALGRRDVRAARGAGDATDTSGGVSPDATAHGAATG